MINDKWDKIIAAHAAYYGLTVEAYEKMADTMAGIQEIADQEGWEV